MKRASSLMTPVSAVLAVVLVCGCASRQGGSQTVDFRHFVRDFFASETYQKAHVRFPLEVVYLAPDEDGLDTEVRSRFITRDDWVHYPGPDYYQCDVDCFDIVIYDNFSKQHRDSGERVLSFEGVSNGINSALHFRYMDGTWFLVKHEQFDN